MTRGGGLVFPIGFHFTSKAQEEGKALCEMYTVSKKITAQKLWKEKPVFELYRGRKRSKCLNILQAEIEMLGYICNLSSLKENRRHHLSVCHGALPPRI